MEFMTIFIYLLRCIFHIFSYFSDECLSSSSQNYKYYIDEAVYYIKHKPYIHLAQRKCKITQKKIKYIAVELDL